MIANCSSHRRLPDKHWVWADEANLVIAYPEGLTADARLPTTPTPTGCSAINSMPIYRDHKQAGAWEATKIMNDTAYPSRAFDFVVERTPIETPITRGVAVRDEFVKPIVWGGELADSAAEVPPETERHRCTGHDRRSSTATRRLGRGK